MRQKTVKRVPPLTDCCYDNNFVNTRLHSSGTRSKAFFKLLVHKYLYLHIASNDERSKKCCLPKTRLEENPHQRACKRMNGGSPVPHIAANQCVRLFVGRLLVVWDSPAFAWGTFWAMLFLGNAYWNRNTLPSLTTMVAEWQDMERWKRGKNCWWNALITLEVSRFRMVFGGLRETMCAWMCVCILDESMLNNVQWFFSLNNLFSIWFSK